MDTLQGFIVYMIDAQTLQLCANRLMLTPFSAQDADVCFQCITPTLTHYMAWEPPESPAVFKEIWQSWQHAFLSQSEIIFSIKSLDSNQFLGLVGIHQLKTATPELGIWIREDFHGYGFGMEAIITVKNWATTQFKPDYFIYPVAIDNRASRRIAEALGGSIHTQQQKKKYMAAIYHIPSE